MGCKGLEVGCDAGAGGGIVTGDGEERTFGNGCGGGQIGRNRRHLRATQPFQNPIILKGNLQPKSDNNYL
jgi:hypothetical protein